MIISHHRIRLNGIIMMMAERYIMMAERYNIMMDGGWMGRNGVCSGKTKGR